MTIRIPRLSQALRIHQRRLRVLGHPHLAVEALILPEAIPAVVLGVAAATAADHRTVEETEDGDDRDRIHHLRPHQEATVATLDAEGESAEVKTGDAREACHHQGK